MLKILARVSTFVHAVLITLYWSLLPGGFPWLSRPFVAYHLIIPLIALAAWITFLSIRWPVPGSRFWVGLLLGFWLGLASLLLGLFPLWFPADAWMVGLGVVGAVGGGVLSISFCWLPSVAPARRPPRHGTLVTGTALGMLLLISGVLLTRAGPAQTRPALVVPAMVPLADAILIPDQGQPILLGDAAAAPDLRLRPDGVIEIRTRAGTLYLSPYLSFASLAQDGLWAIAGNRDVSGVVLREVWSGQQADAPALQVRWEGRSLRGWLHPDDLAGELRISRRPTPDGGMEFQVTSITRVARQLDAHQADVMDLNWSGVQPLSLALGPEPGYPLVPTESDYPFGRPITFLTVLPDGVDLMRASSAEKGPFARLAHWPRHDPVVRVLAAGQLVCTFVLEGFVAQASPELSPTAGWSMPVNSIVVEATAFRDQQPTGVGIGYTLADTGLGRGYHTVGTAPGTYVSTLRITVPAGSWGE